MRSRIAQKQAAYQKLVRLRMSIAAAAAS